MSKMLMMLMMFVPSIAVAQTVEPPAEADEFGWLRWAVIVLLGIVVTGSGTFFAFIKGAYESRIKDKDEEIKRLTEQLTKLAADNTIAIDKLNEKLERLTADKDALHRDMQEKVIPALVSASDLIRTFLKIEK